MPYTGQARATGAKSLCSRRIWSRSRWLATIMKKFETLCLYCYSTAVVYIHSVVTYMICCQFPDRHLINPQFLRGINHQKVPKLWPGLSFQGHGPPPCIPLVRPLSKIAKIRHTTTQLPGTTPFQGVEKPGDLHAKWQYSDRRSTE